MTHHLSQLWNCQHFVTYACDNLTSKPEANSENNFRYYDIKQNDKQMEVATEWT